MTKKEKKAAKSLFGFLKDSVVITGDSVKSTDEEWRRDELVKNIKKFKGQIDLQIDRDTLRKR